MQYQVIFTEPARAHAKAVARYISEEASPGIADAWFEGLTEAILSLSTLPNRGGIARENDWFDGGELRQLVFKSHRIIYTVRDAHVYILHVRHGSQDDLEKV